MRGSGSYKLHSGPSRYPAFSYDGNLHHEVIAIEEDDGTFRVLSVGKFFDKGVFLKEMEARGYGPNDLDRPAVEAILQAVEEHQRSK